MKYARVVDVICHQNTRADPDPDLYTQSEATGF